MPLPKGALEIEDLTRSSHSIYKVLLYKVVVYSVVAHVLPTSEVGMDQPTLIQ
jgi:hypothetical protein